MKKYDAIVLGRGPAGITASIYLKRGNLDILVIGKDRGLLENVGEIENLYPLGKINGQDIQIKGEEHAKSLDIEILEDEVLRIEYTGEDYIVKTKTEEFQTSFIFLGIGSKRKKLDIKNIREYEGRGISYCAICDGFFYKLKDIAIYGNSEYSIKESEMLVNTVNKIYFLTNGEPIEAIKELSNKDPNKFIIVENKVMEVQGQEKLENIIFEDGNNISVSGLFVAEEANNKSFAMQLGLLMEEDSIIVDDTRKTNLDGIYAGGDTIKGVKQVSKAVSDGMIAGLDIIKQYNIKKFK